MRNRIVFIVPLLLLMGCPSQQPAPPPPPTPTPTTITVDPGTPDTSVGAPYVAKFSIHGGTPPYFCATEPHLSGNFPGDIAGLPPGITPTTDCGLAGSATVAGGYEFNLVGHDSAFPAHGFTSQRGITVAPPKSSGLGMGFDGPDGSFNPCPTDPAVPCRLPDGQVGKPYDVPLDARPLSQI